MNSKKVFLLILAMMITFIMVETTAAPKAMAGEPQAVLFLPLVVRSPKLVVHTPQEGGVYSASEGITFSGDCEQSDGTNHEYLVNVIWRDQLGYEWSVYGDLVTPVTGPMTVYLDLSDPRLVSGETYRLVVECQFVQNDTWVYGPSVERHFTLP